MKGLKIAVRFLFGAFYASCIWLSVLTELKDYWKFLLFPDLVITVILLIVSIVYISDNWKNKE